MLKPIKEKSERITYIDTKGSGLVMVRDFVAGKPGVARVTQIGNLTDAARLADSELLLTEGAKIRSLNSGKVWEVIGGAWALGSEFVSGNSAEADVFRGLSSGVTSPSMPPELQPLDWWADRFFGVDAQNLYGHSASNALDFVRVDKVTRARTAIANPFGVANPRAIRAVWVSKLTPGLLLAAVGETSQTAPSMVIWRSDNYGNTWTNVLTLGAGGTGPSDGIWLLSDRNIAEMPDGRLFLGEYNVFQVATRVAGSENDRVAIWMSTDKGASWQEVVAWNEAGSHQHRHVHALIPAPNGRNLLILTGDDDAENAMILWDCVTNISNVPFSANYPVPIQYGSQRTRVVEAVAQGEFWYWMSDGDNAGTGTMSDVGWFRMPLDLSEPPLRLDGKISAIARRDVFYAMKFSNGCVGFIEGITGAVNPGFMSYGIWLSNESCTRIERVGIHHFPTNVNAGGALFMMQYGDTAYISHIIGIAKGGGAGTVSFTVDPEKRFCGVRPDTLHPVYWVDPVNGVDDAATNRGWTPSSPWRTLKYALESNRCLQSGRVILPAGDFDETLSAAIGVNLDQVNADTAGYLTVEGRGMTKTKHSLSATSTVANTYTLGLDANPGLEFKDMWVGTKRDVSLQTLISGGGASTAQRLRAVRARLTGRDLSVFNQTVLLNSNIGAGGSIQFDFYDSEVPTLWGGPAYLISGDTDGPVNINFIRSVCDGGRGFCNPLSTDTVYAEDSLFSNYAVTAIRSGAAATKVPVLRNCRFAAGTPGGTALPQYITDNAALVGAGQFVGARSATPLTPAAFFDASSKVDSSITPKDPRRFVY